MYYPSDRSGLFVGFSQVYITIQLDPVYSSSYVCIKSLLSRRLIDTNVEKIVNRCSPGDQMQLSQNVHAL
jgi:hypothetical protein